jgi:hypothetical protein
VSVVLEGSVSRVGRVGNQLSRSVNVALAYDTRPACLAAWLSGCTFVCVGSSGSCMQVLKVNDDTCVYLHVQEYNVCLSVCLCVCLSVCLSVCVRCVTVCVCVCRKAQLPWQVCHHRFRLPPQPNLPAVNPHDKSSPSR